MPAEGTHGRLCTITFGKFADPVSRLLDSAVSQNPCRQSTLLQKKVLFQIKHAKKNIPNI